MNLDQLTGARPQLAGLIDRSVLVRRCEYCGLATKEEVFQCQGCGAPLHLYGSSPMENVIELQVRMNQIATLEMENQL